MSLDFGSSQFPTDQRSWDQATRAAKVTPDENTVTTVTVADKAITDAKLRDSTATSVMGRAANSQGQPADIVASADNTILMRRSASMEFTTLVDADIPSTIARDTEVTAAINALLALSDPFTQYFNQTRGDARYVKILLSGNKTYDPPSLTAGQGSTTTLTVTGAVTTSPMFVEAAFSNDLQGMSLTAYVSGTDTVSVRFLNDTAGTIDLASGTLWVRIT